jgi:TRAP transporter TAXI family solute receptor
VELKGTAAQQVEGNSGQRLLVYYKAELRFSRDHKLAGWESLNVGSLLWVLGAEPSWIRGVQSDGNRRGDVLKVAGVVTFVGEGRDIQLVANEGRIPSEPEAAIPEPDPPAEQQLARLAELQESLIDGDNDEVARRLQAGIERALADAEAQLAGEQGLIRLATGVTSGEYHALGAGLAEQMNAETATVHVRPSAGSSDNLSLVVDGAVEAAFAQNDVAYAALRGEGLYTDREPMSSLRALCSIYPEAMQLVTRQDSGILSVDDLAGRAVDVGPEESGIRINAEQVLTAAGLTRDQLGRVQGKPVNAALDDLVDGTVDAVFVTGVYPFHEIAIHSARSPLTLVALSEDEVGTLWQNAPFMLPLTIPARTYPGQKDAVRTVGVTALLVVREDLSDDVVTALMDALLAHGEALFPHSALAYFISTETADRGLSIPLHPAARAYLEGAR